MQRESTDRLISELTQIKKKRQLFVVSGPSGAGKTVLCRQALKEIPRLSYSISYTTRPKRPQEVSGEDYFFVSEEQFRQMIEQGQFLEWAEVHGNLYGTSKEFIENQQAQDSDVLLDIDVQGALQIRRQDMPSVLIFVVPPSFDMLEQRLTKRASDSSQQIQTRIHNAAQELTHCPDYDYLIVNEIIDLAIVEINSIILAERCRNRKK